MFVKVLSNHLPLEESTTNSRGRTFRFPVEVGQTYPLVGVTISKPNIVGSSGVFCYIFRANENMIYSVPIEILEVLDCTISTSWTLASDTTGQQLNIGPKSLFENKYLVEDLTEGLPQAIRTMRQILVEANIPKQS